jgi:hypothetical protein
MNKNETRRKILRMKMMENMVIKIFFVNLTQAIDAFFPLIYN